MWRRLRIFILLFVLATVAHRAWLEKQHVAWTQTLYVALYPVNADGSRATANYIRSLSDAQFVAMRDFLAQEADFYALGLAIPFEFRLGAEVKALPPSVPSGGVIDTLLWSLRFRWWAWSNQPAMLVKPHITLYLLFHDPAQHQTLSHSTALSKGRVGLVYLYASRPAEGQNVVVTAHELLHTVGATDKYDLQRNLPLYPHGYAEPDRMPRYPQHYAELMGGRIPLSAQHAEIPASLAQTRVGPLTAMEIGWISPERLATWQ